MIELLGVGIPDARGQWLMRGVCARFEPGVLTAVVAPMASERDALLDAVAGHAIPGEGRVWVGQLPLMRETRARVRARVADVGPATRFTPGRSALWNTLVTRGRTLAGLLRLPRRAERETALGTLVAVGLRARGRQPVSALTPAERVRVGLARAVIWRVSAIVLREVDVTLGVEAAAVLGVARALARVHRLVVVASVSSLALAHAHADRVVVLGNGRLVFDGCARESEDELADRSVMA